MRKQTYWLPFSACGLLLVASCASIVSKTAYPVAITSQPEVGLSRSLRVSRIAVAVQVLK